MERELQFTRKPLDEAALARRPAAAPTATAGACVRFLGIVRSLEAGTPISALEYTAFDAMAEHQFGRLFDELGRHWPTVASVRVVHRLGIVPVGEASLWMEIAAPHRAEAFAACQWLIDEMKRVVPIWKRAIGAELEARQAGILNAPPARPPSPERRSPAASRPPSRRKQPKRTRPRRKGP